MANSLGNALLVLNEADEAEADSRGHALDRVTPEADALDAPLCSLAYRFLASAWEQTAPGSANHPAAAEARLALLRPRLLLPRPPKAPVPAPPNNGTLRTQPGLLPLTISIF